MAENAGCHQKEYRCESRTPRIGAAAAVLNCMTDWAKASTRGRKTAGVQRLGHAETCMEPWLWAGKGIRWSSSGAITKQHGPVAALPHRLRTCRPRLSNQGACIKHRSALRFSGQRFPSVRRADPTVQLDQGHQPYNPAHASCIFCFIGAKNTTDVSAHSSPLSKESSPNHQQVTPLCSKKTSQSAAKPHSLCPKKFYQQSARSASSPLTIFLSVKAKPLETGKAGGLPNLGWVCHRLIAILLHPVRRNPPAKGNGRESKRIYLVPKRSDCELMRAASSK